MMSIQPCDVLMTVDQGMTQVCVMVPRSEKKLEHRYESQDTGITDQVSPEQTTMLNNVPCCPAPPCLSHFPLRYQHILDNTVL